MPQVEQNPTFAEQQEKYTDLRDALSDGNLSDQEREELQERYYADCEEIQSETASKCDDLRKEVEIYTEMSQMSQRDIEKLQILSGTNTLDGLRGPKTFGRYSLLTHNNPDFRGKSPQEIADSFDEVYSRIGEIFSGKSGEERTQIQSDVGTVADGIFGPNTFRAIMKNYDTVQNIFTQESSEDTQVKEVRDEGEEGSQEREEKDEVGDNGGEDKGQVKSGEANRGDQDSEKNSASEKSTDSYNNGLEMTDEAFEVAKIEALENGENPSYKEFQNITNQLSYTEKQQFQELVRAKVDGIPGPNTYTHFMHSALREAGFSLEEAVNLRKVFSENAQEELQAIRDTYDLDENWPQLDMSETESLQFDISPGMFMDYDVDYGILTIYDPESKDVITQDVAEGTFDTISSAFEAENPDIIHETLARLGGNTERKNEYITAMKKYIHDNGDYDIAREFFTTTDDNEGEEEYVINFRGNSDLIREMVAFDIFGDQAFLQDADGDFVRVYEPGRDFKTLDRNERLSIIDGTKIIIPNADTIDRLQRDAEIRDGMENTLDTTITSQRADIIRDYFLLDTIPPEKKQEMLWKIKETIFSQRLFDDMRAMFAPENKNGGFVFQPKNDFLEQNLTAFDIFGDYTELISGNDEYTSENSRDYFSGDTRLSIVEGTEIFPVLGSERSEEAYEILKSPLEKNRNFVREYVPEGWHDEFMEFVHKLPNNEVLKPSDPITLADSSRKEAMYLVNGEYQTFPVIFGSNGFSDGNIASGDRKTPRGVAHIFTYAKLASSPYGDASNTGSTTVLGASLQNSDLGSQGGGKWFHGVDDYRIPNGATWGCVGMNVHIARDIARDIQKNGNKGFGYVA